jgi:hypothetical protein
VVGMTYHYTEIDGDRWSIDFEIVDDRVAIIDVRLNRQLIPAEMISKDWIEKEEDRIECVAFGFQVHS